MNQPAYGIVNLLLYKGLINQCTTGGKGIAITGVALRKQGGITIHITENHRFCEHRSLIIDWCSTLKKNSNFESLTDRFV